MNALLAILNIFIDPAETVRRTRDNVYGWFPPLILGGIINAIYQYMQVPYMLQALQANPPEGTDPARLEQMISTMSQMSRFLAITAPVNHAMMVLLGAGIVFAFCVVFSVNVKFPNLFALYAHVSLINCLGLIAHIFVLRSRGEITSNQQLYPSFGLEMFLSEGAPRLLTGFLSYFSVFNLWHIAILLIGFAALTGVTKARAALVTAPSWILGLLITTVGALFRQA